MKDERLYFVHIMECIDRVRRFTVGGRPAFFQDEMVRDAVLRNLQIMAKSTQRLQESTRLRHPDVDWVGIRRFRNIVVHQYLGIDLELVWGVIETDLDQLFNAMAQELRDLDERQAQERSGGGDR